MYNGTCTLYKENWQIRMLKAKPNNFAILKEYIDTTLSFVLFVVFDSFLKELIHFFCC